MTAPDLDPGQGATAAGRWHDLRRRMASALVLIATGGIGMWIGGAAFAGLAVALAAGMIWELARLTAPLRNTAALVMAAVAAAALILAILHPMPLADAGLLAPALALALTPRRDRRLAAGWAVAVMVAGFGLVALRNGSGGPAVLWLVLVVVASDVLGYFAGRTLGGPKFWPALSPKKTWSGTVAGWTGAAVVGAGFVALGYAGPFLILLSPVVAFAGQMGDIAESWLKRRAGVKDASNLIPGHGGLLDRFDALTGAVVAVMALGLVIRLPLPSGGAGP